MYGHHSSSSSKRHHYNHHRHHHYRRKEYLPEEFKKVRPPTFDGDIKKLEDAQAWLLRMKKFFIFHSYSQNMKAKIATFNLKGKEDIWWEDVNNVKGIQEEDFIWDDFQRIFKKKYLSNRYYVDKGKEFYELQMGSMTDDEYTSRLLELLRYVPYLKEEKAKIQRFISGSPVAYRDQIELDEPRSLEESIHKLKHCWRAPVLQQ